MPKYMHHVLPLISPSLPKEGDKAGCLITIPTISKNGDKFTISLLGREFSIDAIAITFPEGSAVEHHEDRIISIGNHVLSCLRVTYSPSVDIIRFAEGSLNFAYESDSPEPEYNVAITLPSSFRNSPVNVENVKNVICTTSGAAEMQIIALIAESQQPSIPTHYRVLSLIRLLEVVEPDDKKRAAILEGFQSEYEKIEISRQLFKNALPELRTRCAHGISRGGAEPFINSAHDGKTKLPQLLVLLRKITIGLVMERYKIDARMGAVEFN